MTSYVVSVTVGPGATAEDLQYEETSDRAMMRALPEEERVKINQQVRGHASNIIIRYQIIVYT